MSTATKLTGLVLAAAAAAAFAGTPAAASAAEIAQVHCLGLNACKGKSDCRTASNSCKGKGMVIMSSAKECTDKGGKVEK